MQVEAPVTLESARFFLGSRGLIELRWVQISFHNLNIVLDISVIWQWSTSWEFGLSEGATIRVKGWARNMSLLTDTELHKRQLKALHKLIIAEIEKLWLTDWVDSALMRILKNYSIAGHAADDMCLHVETWHDLRTLRLLLDINTYPREIICSSIICIIVTIWPIDVWSSIK